MRTTPLLLFSGFLALSALAADIPEAWSRLSPTVPHKVSVESATRIRCDGVLCRLLGVTERSDAKAGMAKKFAEDYFKKFGGYFSIYNGSNPLSAPDGTPLIWVQGHGNGGPLNIELVRAGLAVPDLSAASDYSFTVPAKEGQRVEAWQQALRDAEADAKNGKPKLVQPAGREGR